jgi:hypothetical protein
MPGKDIWMMGGAGPSLTSSISVLAAGSTPVTTGGTTGFDVPLDLLAGRCPNSW